MSARLAVSDAHLRQALADANVAMSLEAALQCPALAIALKGTAECIARREIQLTRGQVRLALTSFRVDAKRLAANDKE